MQTYKAPLRDMRFVLHEMYGTAELTETLGFEDVSEDLADTILEEAAKMAEGVLLPLNAPGDIEGCQYENGVVRTPKGLLRDHDLCRHPIQVAAAEPRADRHRQRRYRQDGQPGRRRP